MPTNSRFLPEKGGRRLERIKRNERMAALTKWLTDSPNQIFTLSQFCDRFGSANSTMS